MWIIKGRENTDAEIPSNRRTENREAITPKGGGDVSELLVGSTAGDGLL